ncbi:MAG: CAP domain-containing protein [Nitrososphaerales archaeon]
MGWGGVAAAIIAVLLIIAIILALPNLTYYLSLLNGSGSTQYTSTFHIAGGNGSSVSQNPSIFNSTFSISYPSDFAALSNFSLSLINKDRAAGGLSPVIISDLQSGQQHADSMLHYGYFSHWDTQGLKPYMRYSILGGTGFAEENVAYEYTSLPSYLSTSSVEKALANLEYQMINNDSFCCQNGHRDNILNQFHNEVSIGIAYNSTDVFFVEDFVTDYTGIASPVVSVGDTVHLVGNPSQSLNPTSIQVFYDRLPQNLSSATIRSNYSGPYDQGAFIGGILPPCQSMFSCSTFPGAITVQASTWNVGSSNLNIAFSLGNFINKYGNGVYTLYMVQGSRDNPEFLTSISIFVT